MGIIGVGLWKVGPSGIWKPMGSITIPKSHSCLEKKGALRGSHFQKGNAAQAKLVRCIKGAVLEVAVDICCGSPTYKKWVSVGLPAENKRQLLIPGGFGHGFATLTDDVEFLYKADNFYAPEMARCILWNDPELAIDWELHDPVIHPRDAKGPKLEDSGVDFYYEVKNEMAYNWRSRIYRGELYSLFVG